MAAITVWVVLVLNYNKHKVSSQYNIPNNLGYSFTIFFLQLVHAGSDTFHRGASSQILNLDTEQHWHTPFKSLPSDPKRFW